MNYQRLSKLDCGGRASPNIYSFCLPDSLIIHVTRLDDSLGNGANREDDGGQEVAPDPNWEVFRPAVMMSIRMPNGNSFLRLKSHAGLREFEDWLSGPTVVSSVAVVGVTASDETLTTCPCWRSQ